MRDCIESKRYDFLCIGLASAGILLTIVTLIVGRGADGRFGDSVSFHPNVVGFYLAISLISAIYMNRVPKLIKISVCVFIFIGLFLILSKTTLLSVMISFSVLKLIESRRGITSFISGLLLVFLSASIFFIVIAFFYADYIKDYSSIGEGKLLFTLTGRTLIWERILDGDYLNYIGHGLSVFDLYGPQPFDNVIYSAHNEILNQIFSFGIFGGFFILLYYFVSFKLGVRLWRLKRVKFFACVFLYSLIRSIVESPQYDFNYPLIIFGASVGLLSRQVNFTNNNLQCNRSRC